ncbi:MAG TPA: uracil-DNA glycosylase family protein [Gemmatimonadaceae bacterium]|nr:uracil-DNA glycosylase family protein [Gemmatimonadaceae bacterium]
MRQDKSSTFGSRAFAFYTGLDAPRPPAGVTVMNPYTDPEVRGYVRAFLDKFFSDNRQRVLVFGINPGRFGAGITGVTFTDPVALADECGIPNRMQRRRELSSIFVYDFINRMGGPRDFYRRYFLTAVSPLGFTRDGKNLNYYDDRALARSMTPFITSAIEQQIELGARRDHVIVLGMGENLRFFQALNETHRFFGEVHALQHPRPIMQYKRKQLDHYLAAYQDVFERASPTRRTASAKS